MALRAVDTEALNAFFEHSGAYARAAASGCPVRFVPPDGAPIGYEARVRARGEVVTRPDDWHDLFNALVWWRFPRTKAAINEVHAEALGGTELRAERGPLRDAATQFDESGLVVVSDDARLLELLHARRWHEFFWVHRAELMRRVRFLVFGHGLYDALRAPFFGLCGRAALLALDASVMAMPLDDLAARVDEALALRFRRRIDYARPRALTPVPVLGIPGTTPDNETAAYYRDPRQFRPPRPAQSAAQSPKASSAPDASQTS